MSVIEKREGPEVAQGLGVQSVDLKVQGILEVQEDQDPQDTQREVQEGQDLDLGIRIA